jgi:hypothetical protein
LSIWFLLWFVLSFILLGATCWSTIILIQQKKAWSAYAAKKGLTFTRGTFFGPCSMEGVLDDYNLSFFTATQVHEDSRKNRELTVGQINIYKPFVDSIACGTAEVLPFLQSLEGMSRHNVKNGKWNTKFHIFSGNKDAVDAYLTEERIKVLTSILSMPNAHVIIVMDEDEAAFRFETSNPLKEEKQLEVIVDKLIAKIKKLEPTEEEQARFENLKDTETVTAQAASQPVEAVDEQSPQEPASLKAAEEPQPTEAEENKSTES